MLVIEETILRGGTSGDDILLNLVSDVNDIKDLNSKQKENIRK